MYVLDKFFPNIIIKLWLVVTSTTQSSNLATETSSYLRYV